MNKKIALTIGEPAGVGVDTLIQLAQIDNLADVVIIANLELLQQRAELLNLPFQAEHFTIENINLPELNCLAAPAIENVAYVLECLHVAIEGCLSHRFAAIVTGPVDKAIINQAGIVFPGHTEYLAQQTKSSRTVMCFENAETRVALLTTHLPLKEVALNVTQSALTETLTIIYQSLIQRLKIPQPTIAVCGLNPHAGESGYLGLEEQEIIRPVINDFNQRGFDCRGPFPADTIFQQGQFDCILSMYHDQVLPALKYKNFFDTVNITLGLPFIRTSVDHGTALGLAGSGQASHLNLQAALESARRRVLI